MHDSPKKQFKSTQELLSEYPTEPDKLFPILCNITFFGSLIFIAVLAVIAPEQLHMSWGIVSSLLILAAVVAWVLDKFGKTKSGIHLIMIT